MSNPALSRPRPDRTQEIDQFIDAIGKSGATRAMLAGDASFRRYERVAHEGRQLVLMDAPPPWEDVRPFIAITTQLTRLGLSVPTVLAADEAQGFLLLEDFGDASFTRILKQTPAREGELYHAATEALCVLVKESEKNRAHLKATLPLYDQAVYLREVGLFAEWFLPQVVGLEKAKLLREEYLAIGRHILSTTPLKQSTLVHRDYHADNLFWLEDRQGYQAVGMLDYQDALLGDPLYDLISLLEDARRDVTAQTVRDCTQQFFDTLGEDRSAFQQRYAVLAAQRNAKIIGIFARLTVRDGKPHYLSYLPRVWGHFMGDLAHPHLAPLRAFIEQHVPVEYRGVFDADVTLGGLAS
jgi:aminoglycoside/choline kinase family phosphotransferase